MIERGQKPCFSDMTFVQSNSWVGAWKRLFSGENRKNLLFEIEQIIDRTILAIEEYTNKDYIKLLLENLSKAKSGIENLILTYTEHPDTVSNLRVHIINIDLTLKKHGYSGKSETKIPNAEELHKMIENLGTDLSNIGKRTTPLPIVNGIEIKQKTNSSFDKANESFKKFSAKDYIQKHILSSSTSSPDTPISKLQIETVADTTKSDTGS